MVSLAIACQFLCIVALNNLSMSEKGVTKRRILVSGYGVVGITGYFGCGSRVFYVFNNEV